MKPLKHTKKHIFSLLFLLTLFSCSPQESEIPFKLDGYIYIPVSIHGKEFPFIFDTGSMQTRLSQQVVDHLNISPIDTVLVFMLMKKASSLCPVYDKITFDIGGMTVKSRASSSPDSSLSVIGMDIISQLHWQFDFRDSLVRISKKEIFLDPCDSICMVFPYRESPTTTVSVALDSFLFDASFDTGLPSTGIHEEFVLYDTVFLDSLEGKLMRKHQGISAYHNPRYRMMILASASVNNTEFTLPSFLFCADTLYKTPFRGFYIAMPFVADRFKVFNINPESQKITLARKKGEDSTYIKRKKEKWDELVEIYHEEQKTNNQSLPLSHSPSK